MRAANNRTKRGGMATAKLLPLEETLEWIRASYDETLKRRGVRTNRLATRLGVHRDTALDWKSGATPGNVAQVLRDDDLGDAFLACLHVHRGRAKRSDRERR